MASGYDKAFLKLLTFLGPPLMLWFGLGMPTGRSELGILLGGLLSALISFANEANNVKQKKKAAKIK